MNSTQSTMNTLSNINPVSPANPTYISLPVEVTNALACLPDIQRSLHDITLRLDKYELTYNNVEKIKADLYGDDGVEEKLQYVALQSADNDLTVAELKDDNKKLMREVDLLKSVVIRLDRKVLDQENEILDLKGRSMKDNILIHNFQERDGENLMTDVSEAIKTYLGVDVQFVRVHRNAPNPYPNCKPRSITGRLTDRAKKDEILQAQRARKNASASIPFYYTPQNPPKIVERRKQLHELNTKYREEGVNTRVVGDKLIFPSGSLYKDKVVTPRAEDILCCDTQDEHKLDEIQLVPSSEVQEAGNVFIANGANVNTYADVRNMYKKVCRMPKHAKATHKIMVYRFCDTNNKIHSGYSDDGEHGSGRRLLKYMTDNNMCNGAFVVTRWYSGKHIGPKRFQIMEDLVNQVAAKLK